MIDRKLKILLLVLIVVTVVNSYLHFSHPAYKYYRDNVQSFRSDYDDFVSKVRNEFIPTIMLVSTNRPSCPVSPVLYSSSTNTSFTLPSSIPARFFVSGGRRGFSFNNCNFFCGDDFFGYSILDVRPTIIITDSRVFLISPDSQQSPLKLFKPNDNLPAS